MAFTTLGDDADIRRLAPMPEVIGAVRDALLDLEAGHFDLPQRHSFASGASVVMPIYHAASSSVLVKTLTLDPSRTPLIKGTVTWSSSGEADPIVADARSLTAIRTGAIVGVAIDLMARVDATNAVVFGVGTQSRDQVRAALAVRDLQRITLVSREVGRALDVAESLREEFPTVDFQGVADHRAALRRCDIVCCATSATTPLFDTDDLPEDALVTAIGSYTPVMHELPQALLSAATAVVVDDPAACIAEAGEIIAALESGAISADQLLSLGAALRKPPPQFGWRVFKSVGVAVQDWAAMHVVSRSLSALQPTH